MIVLFSDFGLHGPYIGQVKAVLYRYAPDQPVIDLFSDAPVFDIRCSAYLLAAYVREFPSGTVFCAVVDPGVGTDARQPVYVEAAGYRLVGPDNGLFSRVVAMDPRARCWRIDWRPENCSDTFHGRDLFAPVAARLAAGDEVAASPFPQAQSLHLDWPADHPAVIYVDHFGNAMTGIQAQTLMDSDCLLLRHAGNKAVRLGYARTYNEVDVGQGFWYRNSNGLVEIAVNQGHAGQRYGLSPGTPVVIQSAG
jgi:S-adenosylmethionine hydrolase